MKKTFLSFIVLGILSTLLSNEVFVNDKSKDLKITIYSQGIGFIKERRDFYLPDNNETLLSFVGVPKSIIIDSIVPIFSNPYTMLFSQSFEYNILNYQTILEYYKKNNLNVNFYETQKNLKERVFSSGRILSLLDNRVTIQKDSGEIVTVLINDLVFNKHSNFLARSKPSLTWRIKSKKGNQSVFLHYLTNNISWLASYTLSLDKKADLRGWINIENSTGVTFDNASISCISGEINRAYPKPLKVLRDRSSSRGVKSLDIKDEPLSGYHLYKIPFKEKLSQGSKQINFIDKSDINYREYAYINMNIPMHQIYGVEKFAFDHILELDNRVINGLGVNLPKGKIRVFSKDKSKELHFVGEDYINNISKGDRLKINIGKFTDIKGEIKQILFKSSSRKSKKHLLTKLNYYFHNKDSKSRVIKMMLNYDADQRHKIKSNCKSPCSKEKIVSGSYLYTIKLEAGEKYNYTLEYELNPF